MDDGGDLRDLRLIAVFNDRGEWAIAIIDLIF